MVKKLFILFALGIFLVSCASVPTSSPPPKPQEVIVKIQAADPAKVTIQEQPKDRVNKSMEVSNPEGRLSQLSFISNDKAFVKIFSGLSVADVTRLWNDFVVLENNTTIRDVNLFPEEKVLKSRPMPPVLSPARPYLFLQYAMSAWPLREPFSWCTKPRFGNGRDAKPLRIFNPRTS
jgi:hypothetical protein